MEFVGWSLAEKGAFGNEAIAINSSPRMDKGNTATVLAPFLEGMREAGAEVDVFRTQKLTIGPCRADFACYIDAQGRCSQRDDMDVLLPTLAKAEVWVFATPLYWSGASGPMKNLMDRLLPILSPFVELHDGQYRKPLREGVALGKVVLVSSCSFWEIGNFDPLLLQMKAMCRTASRVFAGALLRPHSRSFRVRAEEGALVDDVLEAAREAGRQLVRDGAMSSRTLDVISRAVVPWELFLQEYNEGMQKLIAAHR